VADAEEPEQGTETAAESTCLPCRGTGTVVSYLGGNAASVACPWCEGTGTRHPGVDAQGRWQAASSGDEGRDGAVAETDSAGA
jgi:DnaJ-class molecular chaperone